MSTYFAVSSPAINTDYDHDKDSGCTWMLFEHAKYHPKTINEVDLLQYVSTINQVMLFQHKEDAIAYSEQLKVNNWYKKRSREENHYCLKANPILTLSTDRLIPFQLIDNTAIKQSGFSEMPSVPTALIDDLSTVTIVQIELSANNRQCRATLDNTPYPSCPF